MGNEPHVPSNERGVHKSVGSLDGGACLDHNEGGFKKDSCCYRWQAKGEPRGGKYHEVYADYPLRSDKAGVRARVARFREGGGEPEVLLTSQYTTSSGGSYPSAAQYSDELALPEEGDDWKLNGPGRVLPSRAKSKAGKAKVVPAGKNFTKAYWPYWNNAHHLISKATFAERVSGIERLGTRQLVQVGLLRAMYNINHHKNVLFLPMDEEVGQLVLLPRHLTLAGRSAIHDPSPYFNHTRYNALVDTELKSIVVDGYCAEVDRALDGKKLCDVVQVVKLSIKKLEDLSEQCFDAIRDFGKKSAGAPLVDMTSL